MLSIASTVSDEQIEAFAAPANRWERFQRLFPIAMAAASAGVAAWFQLSLMSVLAVAALTYVVSFGAAHDAKATVWIRNRVVPDSIQTGRIVGFRSAEGDPARYCVWLRLMIDGEPQRILYIRCEVLSLQLQGKAASGPASSTEPMVMRPGQKLTVGLPPGRRTGRR
jgi:hypothetical protein